jgi:hypothetical protein
VLTNNGYDSAVLLYEIGLEIHLKAWRIYYLTGVSYLFVELAAV